MIATDELGREIFGTLARARLAARMAGGQDPARSWRVRSVSADEPGFYVEARKRGRLVGYLAPCRLTARLVVL